MTKKRIWIKKITTDSANNKGILWIEIRITEKYENM